jgi:opacity protein-like surface antigen
MQMFAIKKLLGRWPVLLLLLFCVPSAQAQVAQAYRGDVNSLWVGAEYSNQSASFPYKSGVRVTGVGAFASYDLNLHYGVEATARFLQSNTIYSESENSYLIGPHYQVGIYGKFIPYARVLFGLGSIQYPQVSGRYFSIAPAVGVSYRLSKKWSLRGDYEYQYWLNSPGFSNEPENRITPSGFNLGLAYRLFHKQPFGEKLGEY